MMLGMSTYLKLTFSYIKPSLGRLHDVTTSNGTVSDLVPHQTSTLGNIPAFAPDPTSAAAIVCPGPVGVVMTFAYWAQVQRLRLASRLLPRGHAGNDSDSDSDSEASASANVMLDASDYEHDYTPPRHRQRTGVDSNRSSSDDTEESVLAATRT